MNWSAVEVKNGRSVFQELTGALFPLNARARWLAMIRVYGDISGKPHNRAMVVGCYVGRGKSWDRLELELSRMLERERLPYFHAVEFFSCTEAFCNWTRDNPRHAAFAAEITALPNKHSLVGWVEGMDPRAFLRIMRPELEKIKARMRPLSPRCILVSRCLTEISKWLLPKLPKGERAQVILESEQGIGDVIDYFKFCQRRREPWTDAFWSVNHLDKVACRPVQVADLLAHLAWKRANGWMRDPPVEPGGLFKNLLAGHGVQMKVMREAEIKANVPLLRDFLLQNPDGLVITKRRQAKRTA